MDSSHILHKFRKFLERNSKMNSIMFSLMFANKNKILTLIPSSFFKLCSIKKRISVNNRLYNAELYQIELHT